ncbi:MAG: hypothetical protein R6W82_10080 [bacterium]
MSGTGTEPRKTVRTALFIHGLAALVLTGPAWLPGRTFVLGDWAAYFLPMREHLSAAWRAGDLLPQWWSAVQGGIPVAANPQFGLFYPPHLLLVLLPLGTGLALVSWLHMVWGALGMTVLLRSRGADRWPAVMAGLVYLAAGPSVSSGSLVSLSLALAWLPWVLHWFPRGLEAGASWPRRGAAAALAAMFLCGGLEILLWTLFLLPFWSYASARVYLGPGPGFGIPPRPAERLGPVLLGFLVVGTGALLLAGAQLVPAVGLILRTTRTAGVGTAESAAFFTGPGRLLGLIMPWHAWDPGSLTSWVDITGQVRAHYLPGLYMGVPVLVLAAAGWRHTPAGDRSVLTILTLLTLLLGLGGGLPLIGRLDRLIPGSGYYRFDEKYLLMLLPAFSCFAGWGLHSVNGRRRGMDHAVLPRMRSRLPLFLMVGGGTVLAGAALLAAADQGVYETLLRWTGLEFRHPGAGVGGYRDRQVLGLAVTGLTAVLSGWALRKEERVLRRAAPAAVVLLVAAELLVGAEGYFPTASLDELKRPVPAARAMLETDPAGRAARWTVSDREEGPLPLLTDHRDLLRLHRKWLLPNVAALQGVRTFDGLSALRIRSLARAEAGWRRAPEVSRPPLAAVLGIRYILLTDPETARRLQHMPGMRALYPTDRRPPDPTTPVPPLLVLEQRGALRPWQMVYDWTTAPGDSAAFAWMAAGGFDPSATVVLGPFPDGGDGPAPAPPPPPPGIPAEGTSPDWRIELLSRGPDRIRLRVDSDRPGVLVRSQAPYPGWRAEVDGAPTGLHSANVVMQALPLEAGTQEVTFRFRLPGLLWGGIMSVLGLLWLLFPLLSAGASPVPSPALPGPLSPERAKGT